jgi:hypothetical protein
MNADCEDAPAATRPLTEADKIVAFRACTRSFPKHYAAEIAAGMTDDQLAAALERHIGILGGASARKYCPSIAYRGAGLCIWASWGSADFKGTPIYSGVATLRLARQLYGIADPDERQLQLL